MANIPSWKIPIGDDCFMVGRRDGHSLLQCNTYLRTFHVKGSPLHWCVDPGSRLDYDSVRSNLLEHIGHMSTLRMFSINHQDPDVVGNLPKLVRESPHMTGLASEDTWRLVRHLNANPKRLCFVNQADKGMVHLPQGNRIQVLPTPFCHFRGAMALYDPEARILFSGDLFGGLNAPGRSHILGEEEDWPGIAQFHQIYMPTREAVAYAIRQIRALRPKVKVVAPQHGFVLLGDFMQEVLERLEKLPVGLDLLSAELNEKFNPSYRDVFVELMDLAAHHLGHEAVLDRLRQLPRQHELRKYLTLSGKEVDLKSQGFRALPLLVEELGRDQFTGFRSLLKSCVLLACTEKNIPLPQLGVGLGENEPTQEDE